MKTTLGQTVNNCAMQHAKGATQLQVSVRVDVIEDGQEYFVMKVNFYPFLFLNSKAFLIITHLRKFKFEIT